MADQPVTKEKLINADIDVDNLGKAANEKVVINPRYGDPYKSVPLVIEEMKIKADQLVAQGFYKGYTTEALLLADKPNVAEMRARADDTRKIYRWTRTSAEGVTPVMGTWVDTGASDKDLAQKYTDNVEQRIPYKNLFDETKIRLGKYLRNSDGKIATSAGWAISEYIPVMPNNYYTLSGKLSGRVSFFANKDDSSIPISTIGGTLPKTFQVPIGANYLVFNVHSLEDPVFTNIQLEKGETVTRYANRNGLLVESLNPVELVERLDDAKLAEKIDNAIPGKPYEIKNVSPNLFQEELSQPYKYLRNTNGYITDTTDEGWLLTGFIPLEAGESYTISGKHAMTTYTLFRTTTPLVTDIILTDVALPATGADSYTFTAPSDCYLVMTLDHPEVGTHLDVQIEKGTAATPYYPYGVSYKLNPDFIEGFDPAGSTLSNSTLELSGGNLTIRAKDHTNADIEVGARFNQATSYNVANVFNFTSCRINNTLFTNMNDDVAPYYIDKTVVGANHGYDKMKVTSNAHGKTVEDCGSLWSADSKQWVLIAVVDVNNLLFMCATEARSSITASQLTHVSDAVNTSTIAIGSAVSSQLYPVFKNRQLKIIVDGVEIDIKDSLKRYSKSAIVKESYEVMLRSDIVANIRANKGVQLAEFNALAAFRVNISYVFDHEAGCTIEQDFLILKQTTLESLTMMQSILVSATNGTVYYYVPKSLPVSIDGTLRDFRQPIDMRGLSVSQAQIYFTAEELENPENPVDRAYQINNISVFATGFLPVADAKPARRLENVERQFWGVRGDTLKTYPKLAVFDTSKPVNIGEYYSCISYKKWFSKQAEQTACFPIRSSAGDFLYIDWHSIGLKSVKIPNDFKHRSFSVVEKSANVNLLSDDFVQEELLVNIQSGQYGYLVLKFQ